ncbi:MAG: proline--tRNA ligase [Chloroflexi bacterium]|nr:proline--tRNA ligase [Chloroflexota bacterium]
MRMTKQFSQTLRDTPSEAEVASHQLLLRAGYVRQLGAGIFSALPFARRSLTKIENIMRDEINAMGGQELTMPVIHPADLWKETGRWYAIGDEMGRFTDRGGREMALAMTHEEVVADLARKEIRSYKQLPQLIYHIQTKWRDDPRPRAGLIRVREFTMLDSYSLDADDAGLDAQYRAHYQAYFNIFNRCALDAIAVKADVGMMGGSLSHEYMYLTPIGEDTLMLCDACGSTANRQVARFHKPPAASEASLPLEKIATPDCKTIDALAQLLNIPKSKTAKAVFLLATITEQDHDVEKFVFAVVRGDMDVNETKLANAVRAKDLRPAREDEIRATGATPGYASPIGLRDVIVIVDDAIPGSPNLVAGANDAGYHLLNTNVPRDYAANLVTDIAIANEGDACPNCGNALRAARGVEVGNIFKLGTRYTEVLGARYLAADKQLKPIWMGSYGIGSGRLLACIAEEHHDEYGLCLPITVAPYQVHLVALGNVTAQTESVYAQLRDAGIEVLFDDRDATPGVKFNDADLIGVPLRVTISERSLKQNSAEFKRRTSKDRVSVPLDETVARVRAEIAAMFDEIRARVVPVAFKD